MKPISPPIAAPVGATPVAVPDDSPTPDAKLWLGPLALLALIQFGAPLMPVSSLGAAVVGVVLLTVLYVAGVVLFSLGMARQRFALPVVLAGCALSAIIYKAIERGALHSRLAAPAHSLALLLLATFFGLLVSRLIRHANMIGPIGVMVALIDIWGVLFGGIVSQLLTNKATKGLAHAAMASGPKLGAAGAKFGLALPDVGLGDYLFLALFLGLLVRFGMNWRASAWWMGAGICAALLAITLLPFVPALPGLLFIGLGAVLPNLRYFTFTRDERFALLYAGVFVVILTIALYFGLTAMLPHK